MGIVTDSGKNPDGTPAIPANVYAIHKLFKTESQLAPLYAENRGKYKVLKDALIEDIDAFIKPMRERRAAIAANPKKVMKILAKGAKVANKKASAKLAIVKKTIGVV